MKDERTLRVAEAATMCGADWAILTAPDAVFYASQVDTVIETGPSPFAGGPGMAVVGQDGTLGVVASSLDEVSATTSAADHVAVYRGIDINDRSLVEDRFTKAAAEALGALDVSGTVAIQRASFPWSVGQMLSERGVRMVGIDQALNDQRCTKTPEEIERLRWCAHLTDLGQAAALNGAGAGRTELQVWAEVRLAMEAAEGRRVPVAGDLTSGIDSTAAISGWPTDRVLEEGDPILCDLAPRARGYWGDSCNTIVVGTPPAGFHRLYRATEDALSTAVERLRPGISAGDFDQEVRSVFDRHGVEDPIHMGHGIGTGAHEWPRIVPNESATIREGMVLMLEPGAYATGVGGVRLEWMFLVTASGNEVLSGFPHLQAPAPGHWGEEA